MRLKSNKLLYISLGLNVLLFGVFVSGCYGTKSIQKTEKYVVEKQPVKMTDWNMFTMALMTVESELDSTAVSSVGAKGYFQITPIYIKEVNRIHHTNYTMDDVYDLETAYEIFDLMQQAHNKEYDMDKALILHNGDHKWYKKRVMDAYEDIKKYEDIRNRLIQL